ncbi:MAG: helix-turn-helix transcriptional regulator [Pseudomonadota bacterium]
MLHELYQNQEQMLNYYAIELLAQLDNLEPTEAEIAKVEKLLNLLFLKRQMIFHSKLGLSEVKCLHYAALGKTSKETAQIMALDINAIESLRRRIKHKLRSPNLLNAITRGMELGYLSALNCPVVA